MIAVVMGSKSDWGDMCLAVRTLHLFDVPYEYKVISAHRTPDLLTSYAKTAKERGILAIIAGAGGAAHLPGMLAANTQIPVLGVPLQGSTSKLNGLDSLLSISQMPQGTPVATFSLNATGAKNAALFAIGMLALNNPVLAERLEKYREELAAESLATELLIDL